MADSGKGGDRRDGQQEPGLFPDRITKTDEQRCRRPAVREVPGKDRMKPDEFFNTVIVDDVPSTSPSRS